MRRRHRPGKSPEPDYGPGSTSLPLDPPLEDLAAPTWLLDRKGAVAGANRSARALESAAGRPLPLSTPSCRDPLAEGSELKRAVEEGRPLEVCVRGPEPSCRRRVVLEPLRTAEGSPAGAILIAPEAGIPRRSRSFYARVLGAAAREMQSPLASLRSFGTLARRAAGDGDPARARLYLERLERHAQRLDYFVGEIRDLVEVLSGKVPLDTQPMDLAAEVRGEVDSAAAAARDHVFEIAAPPEAVVVADRARVRRVLQALLSNAVRFSPGGGRIRVELKLSSCSASLAVTDTGAGVPESRLEDLFDGPCWDPESASGGLGLGLYLARETVEMHGGCIRAEAADGPQGTRLVVTLPRLRRVLA